MTSITATALRQNIYQTIAQVNENCTPIAITNSKGKGAVLNRRIRLGGYRGNAFPQRHSRHERIAAGRHGGKTRGLPFRRPT